MRQGMIAATRLLTLAAVAATGASVRADVPEKVTFDDHIKPIFRNHCAGCHSPEEKNSDLDVMTFSSLLAGGASGAVVAGGDADGSRLLKVIVQSEEPKMPPDSPPIPEAEIALVKAWIAGGLLEKADSKKVMSGKPKASVALMGSAVDKPEGPVAMPVDLLLEPMVNAERSFAVGSIASSPWAPLLAIAAPKQVLLYHSETLELLGILPFPEGFPEVVKFSRNGSLLLVGGGRGGQQGLVALYNVESGERELTVGDEYDSVLAADISGDQQQIALGGPGKLIRIYSTKTGELIRSIKKHTDWVTALEFSPDAVLLASGDRAGGLHVWEAFSGNLFYTLNGHQAGITDLSWRADSNVVASASEDKTVRLWEMFNGNNIKNWGADGVGVLAVDYARDGRIVTAGRDKTAKIWDGEGNAVRTLEAMGDLVTTTSFNHDGTRVIAGDWTGAIRVWKSDDGAALGTLTMNPPTLAERIAEIDAKLPELRAAVESTTAAATTAKGAHDAANQQHQSAQGALAAAQTTFQTREAELTKQRQSAEAAQQAVGPAQADLDAKRTDHQQKVAALDTAKKTLETTTAEKALVESSVTVQVKLVDDLKNVLAEARQVAETTGLDAEKIRQAAQVVEQALAMASESLQASQTELQSKTQAVEAATAAAQSSEQAVQAAAAAVPVAEQALAAANATWEQAKVAVTEGEKQLAEAKSAVDAATPVAQQAEEAFKNASANLEQSTAALQSAQSALDRATADRRKWEIGQVRVELHAVREQVADREAKLAEATAKAEEIKGQLDQAAGEVAEHEAFLAAGPTKMEEANGKISGAQAAIDAANGDLASAMATLAKKEALLGDFDSQTATLEAAVKAEPENKPLQDALARAVEAKGLLAAARDQAKAGVADKEAAVQQRIADKAAAEKARGDLEKQLADAPGVIEGLKKKHAEVAELFQKHQAEVDAASAEWTKVTEQAQSLEQQIATLAGNATSA